MFRAELTANHQEATRRESTEMSLVIQGNQTACTLECGRLNNLLAQTTSMWRQFIQGPSDVLSVESLLDKHEQYEQEAVNLGKLQDTLRVHVQNAGYVGM